MVALEEHYTVPGIVSRIDPAAVRRRGFPAPDVVWAQVIKRNELANLGGARLADMDASRITVQVLSVAGPGADVVLGAEGIALARDYNNALAEAAQKANIPFPLAGVPAISIGPVTSQTLREHNWPPAAEADPHDISGLVAAVQRVLSRP